MLSQPFLLVGGAVVVIVVVSSTSSWLLLPLNDAIDFDLFRRKEVERTDAASMEPDMYMSLC